ncbi:MAG: Histidine kinase protein [Ignavibacteria bacterium]|nr:Histidine kinase protein [Ignavibacteria bacterium]
MKESIFTLTPERVRFPQFWIELRKRNRWLIMLRYGAVTMLVGVTIVIMLLKNFLPAFRMQTNPLWLIAAAILFYNLFFHVIWYILPDYLERHPKLHSLHFSMLQIVVDLIALMVFIYYTGGVESPLYALFFFHVIIGSLFLTSLIVNLLITSILILTISGAILEYNGFIAHYSIQGLLSADLHTNLPYIILFFAIFGITLYLSAYLANSVAKTLYHRERSLTTALDKLEEAEKSKSRYVMSVVHDLKTPIAAVLTYLNMFLEGALGALTDEQRKPLDRSKQRLSAAINLINDILYISKLKLGEHKKHLSDVEVRKMFEYIYLDMKELFTTRDISFEIKCNTTYEINIFGDPQLLGLAFGNLLSNAYKYSEKGGRVDVLITDLGDIVEMTIADNGIGIPENEQEKIFQDFYRTQISKKKGIEGSGLGLTLVSQIIHEYGGSIKVASPSRLHTDGSLPGTEFTIRLPKKHG